jgi:hypothetical protein
MEMDCSNSSGKKAGKKLGLIEVCGNFKGYFSEGRATHILNPEWAHMHVG